MKLGRNEPCHCGSGKKYKHCHEPTKNTNNNQYAIIGIIAVIILVIIFINSDNSNSNQNVPVTTRPLLNQASTSNKSKPSGPAPPGKVWSQEHGHWHDAPVSKSLTPKLVGKDGVNKITVPPNDKKNPPEGKVWDDEHGHFHDKE